MWLLMWQHLADARRRLSIALASLRSTHWTWAGGSCCRYRARLCRSRCTPPCRPRPRRPTPRGTTATPSSRRTCPGCGRRSGATSRCGELPLLWTRSWRRSRPRPRHTSRCPPQNLVRSGRSSTANTTPDLEKIIVIRRYQKHYYNISPGKSMDINVKIILYFVIFCCWLLNFSAMQGINRLLPAIKTYIFKFQSLMSTYTIIIIVLYLFVGDEVFVSINHSDLQKRMDYHTHQIKGNGVHGEII